MYKYCAAIFNVIFTFSIPQLEVLETATRSCYKQVVRSLQLRLFTIFININYSIPQLEVATNEAHYLLLISFSTASGFNSVLTSPKLSTSPDAIFLNIRLMIFPERVFGRSSTN